MAEVNQDAITAARAAGYSDDEIVAHLAQSDKRFATAKEAGYSGKEILGHLVGGTSANTDVSAQSKAPASDTELDLRKQLSALGHGATSAVAGYGETAKQFLGMKDAGDAAQAWAARNAPANYDPAWDKLKTGDVTALPRVVSEASPGILADVVSTGFGSKVGGAFGGAKGRLIGGALGGIASYMARNAGNTAKEVGAEQGNTGDLTPAQKAQGAAVALAGAGVNQLGLKLGPMAGTRIATTGAQGVLDAAKAFGLKSTAEGVSGGGQQVVDQLGTTAGSEKGMRITDPAAILAGGAVGAAMGGALSLPRATRDVAGAVRERNTDTDAATRVSNRIVERAGSPEALSDPRLSFETVSRVKADIGTELADAAKSGSLSTEAQNAVNAARSGKALNDTDLAHIDRAGDPQLSALARDANEVTRLTDRGQFGSGKFEGGVTAVAKNLAMKHPFAAKTAALTAGGATAAAGIPAMLGAAASAAPYVGGLWVAGRSLDHMTGMRSPARSYTEKFADGGATRLAPAMAPQPQPGPTQGAFQGGAPVPPGQGPWGRAPSPVTVPNVAQAPVPQPGLAAPPPGFQNLLQTAVMTINKGQKQQAAAAKQQGQQTVMQAMPLLRQLAAQNGPKQQASIDKMSAGIDQGIAALVQGRPQAPLGLPPPQAATAPQPAIPMGAPAPQLALPAPSRPQLPATLPPVAARPAMTPPPAVINLPGAPGPAPAPQPAAQQPVPSRQAAEVYRQAALAKQIADLHNEEVRRARVQAALANTAPAKAPPKPAPALKPSAPAIVEALKAEAEPIVAKQAPVDDGIPDFLKRTRDEPKGPLAEAMTKKSLLEAAFKDEPVAEDSPYTVKHVLPNGKTFDMFAPHKEFADAGKMSAEALADKIIQRAVASGKLRTTEEDYRAYLVPRIQGKRDLAYKLADVTGVDRIKMDQHIQQPQTVAAAKLELQRIKDQWPTLSKKIDKILSTAGLENEDGMTQDAMTLWKPKPRAKKPK